MESGLTAAQHGGRINLMEADVPADRSEIAAGSTVRGAKQSDGSEAERSRENLRSDAPLMLK